MQVCQKQNLVPKTCATKYAPKQAITATLKANMKVTASTIKVDVPQTTIHFCSIWGLVIKIFKVFIHYQYMSNSPALKEFLLRLFKATY